MRLSAHAYVLTGVERFDYSLGSMTVWHDRPGGPLVLVSSGLYGGMSSWQLSARGDLVLRAMQDYPITSMAVARDTIVVAENRGLIWAFHGRDPAHFVGFEIAADGTLGPHRRTGFERVTDGIAAGDAGLLQVWAHLHDIAPPGRYGASEGWLDTRGIAVLPNGTALLVSAQSNALHRVTPSGNAQSFGAELGFAAPSSLVLLPDMGAGRRVVIAGAGSSSLSVLRAEGSGFVGSDHLLDTMHTAFSRPQALTSARVSTARGPLDLVLAGGADHGVTLFAATPQGQLIWLDTYFDTAATGLYNVASLQAVVQPQRVVVLATSERDPGITVLHVPVGSMGGLVLDGQGGALDDILLASPTATRLTGGAGADIFVIPSMTERVTITDFEVGRDRIDLTDWPMLRDLSQLNIGPRSDGALIQFRDHSLRIRSSNGAPLDAEALFPQGLQGPDRVMKREFALSETELPPGTGTSPLPAPTTPPLPPSQTVSCNIFGLRARLGFEIAAAGAQPALSSAEASAALHEPRAPLAQGATSSSALELLDLMLAETASPFDWTPQGTDVTQEGLPLSATRNDEIAEPSESGAHFGDVMLAQIVPADIYRPEPLQNATFLAPPDHDLRMALPGTGLDWF